MVCSSCLYERLIGYTVADRDIFFSNCQGVNFRCPEILYVVNIGKLRDRRELCFGMNAIDRMHMARFVNQLSVLDRLHKAIPVAMPAAESSAFAKWYSKDELMCKTNTLDGLDSHRGGLLE